MQLHPVCGHHQPHQKESQVPVVQYRPGGPAVVTVVLTESTFCRLCLSKSGVDYCRGLAVFHLPGLAGLGSTQSHVLQGDL